MTFSKTYLQKIQLPPENSHKGQNGKLLIIGGSELFHVASKWSLDIASKFVDMVFYSSIPSNNELVKKAKGEFWNGIVVERDDLENYIDESDCILIGPGMTRSAETEELTNALLKKYPHKKWVVDAGALQMVDVHVLNEQMILTPHQQELQMLLKKTKDGQLQVKDEQISNNLAGATVVVKGVRDLVISKNTIEIIEGGNPGMTKGGTGDILAGLIAAIYCKHDALTAAVVGSYINKKAGDSLYGKVGPYFNASDLVNEIPRVLWSELQKAAK